MSVLPNIRNITVTGRIASGATTLAKQISDILGWNFIEGGKYNDAFFARINQSEVNVHLRPDSLDTEFDAEVKHILKNESHFVIQSHLAGFNAQGIDGVFKILTVCEDKNGVDRTEIRIDRLVNRKNISVEEAKDEVQKREAGNLEKWRKLYANNDQNWVHWNPKYYDLIINTFTLNREASLEHALKAIGYNPTS